jgi:hypothetical protein
MTYFKDGNIHVSGQNKQQESRVLAFQSTDER